MLAISLLTVFLATGIYISLILLHKQNILVRIWIGLCLGLVMLMVFPCLFAFIFSFDTLAHVCSLLLLPICIVLAYKRQSPHNRIVLSTQDKSTLRNAALLVLPFALLISYLQYTHNIMPKNDALYVGQSTYGDLSLHLSIITSTPHSKFPMEYSIFPGKILGYPFLIDTLSSSLYMYGLSLQASVCIPGILVSILIFFGYYMLVLKCTDNRRVAVLAFILLFVNGGLGFVYDLDLANGDLASRFNEIFTGFYKTPVNRPEPHNLVWANIIADMILPQRTFMAGMLVLLPCIHLIISPYKERRHFCTNELIILIFLASSLPMINTHAFLALGLFSVFQMILQIIDSDTQVRKQKFLQFAIYGAITLALTFPQLLLWTFKQSFNGSKFLSFHFNWINNVNGTLKDIYPFFYLKNMGIVIIPIIMSLFTKNTRYRNITLSALSIFILAELIQFQPNAYDNNKLIYYSFMIILIPTSMLLIKIYDLLKGIPARAFLAIFFIFTCTFSGALSLTRECLSQYQAYDSDSIALAEYIENNTAKDSMFITANNHLNAVSSLAGRRILCGPDLWLYFHGIDTNARKARIKSFYNNPSKSDSLISDFNVNYILYSYNEEYAYNADKTKLDNEFTKVYFNNKYTLYKVN